MSGWIKLHRNIKQHWIFEDAEYFKAWITLLLMASYDHTSHKVRNKLQKVKRGEFFTTERELSTNWNWSKTKVRTFLELLQSDNMIKTDVSEKKTKIFIVNYTNYQDLETIEKPKKNQEKTIEKPKKNQEKTTKEEIKKRRSKEYINLLRKLMESGFEIEKDFIPLIEKWLHYKGCKSQSYKSEESLKAFISNLLGLSGSSSEIAQQIIDQSMCNNWSGIFALKQNGGGVTSDRKFDITKMDFSEDS